LLLSKIGNPEKANRKEHLEYILDLLMNIGDEYQAVMLEKEEAYWDSIEMWHDEFQQRAALKWVTDSINK
ncbi:MAG TPA: hypothetical protein VGI82_00840, partial [Chitinophagaceae bacterium]